MEQKLLNFLGSYISSDKTRTYIEQLAELQKKCYSIKVDKKRGITTFSLHLIEHHSLIKHLLINKEDSFPGVLMNNGEYVLYELTATNTFNSKEVVLVPGREILLAPSPKQFLLSMDSEAQIIEVDIFKDKEEKEAAGTYYAVVGKNKEFLSLDTVLEHIAFYAYVYSIFTEAEKDQESVEIINTKLVEKFSNHALIMKLLDGFLDIANGEKDYMLSPRSGTSKESYLLTAPQTPAYTFFYEVGGNQEILKRTVEVIQSLIQEGTEKGFITSGRVWFTLNTIIQEMLRTTGGTIKAKDARKTRRIVDWAIFTASSGQVVGYTPNGDIINTLYVSNAIKREKVEYNGNLYSDVWGFEYNEQTINSYAKELKQTYNYPLLEMDAPLTLQQAAVERYVKDLLNQARGKLYTKAGKPTKTKQLTIERSWNKIEQSVLPTKQPTSRQRENLVRDFEEILQVIANMEKDGKGRQGRPLFIKSYSVRNKQLGTGKGKREKLVIECSSTLKKVSIDLN